MSTERLIPISQLDEIVKGSFPVSLQADLSAPHVSSRLGVFGAQSNTIHRIPHRLRFKRELTHLW